MMEVRNDELGERAVRAMASAILCAPAVISYYLLKFIVCLSCSRENQGKLVARVQRTKSYV